MFGGKPRRRRRGGAGRRRPGDVPGQGGGAQPDRPLRGPGRGRAGRPSAAQTTSARIRDALTQDRLSLATQPIRSLASGGIERYELLLRMTGDDGELLPAASFIEAAERSGMVQELDRWVVGRALELLAERERAGEPVSLHVNLSGASLTDLSVLEFIERRLDEGDADPGRCTFEITQTARVEDYDTAAGFADRLTEFGCEVAIDDYGAGFGPFNYLKRIPFDVIKIDGAFIRDMPRNDADQLTVQAIVQIARGLGKRTIAEFVQDDDTTRMLREYGVDMAQGFHLGRPVDRRGSGRWRLGAVLAAPARRSGRAGGSSGSGGGHRLFGRRAGRGQSAELARHLGAVQVGVVADDQAVADGQHVAALEVDPAAVGDQPFEAGRLPSKVPVARQRTAAFSPLVDHVEDFEAEVWERRRRGRRTRRAGRRARSCSTTPWITSGAPGSQQAAIASTSRLATASK